MTCDEAKKEQERYLKNPCPVMTEKTKTAMRLGIEALKFYKGIKEWSEGYKGTLLPGETEK